MSPTSQSIPIAHPSDGTGDEFDRDGALEHDDRGSDLGAELRGRMKVDDVVEQAEREHDRAARGHGEDLSRNPDRPDRRREQDRSDEAGEDADAAERRRRARVPPVGARVCAERTQGAGRAEQAGDHREADRCRRERGERVHGGVSP